MTAYEYLQRYGKPRAAQVALDAGSCYEYFSHLAYGHRTPSARLAQKLVTESNGEMSLSELLFPPKRKATKAKTAAYVTKRSSEHRSKG